MFRGMRSTPTARASLGLLGAFALAAAGCAAAGPSPKTMVDQVAQVDSSAASDASPPSSDAATTETADVDPVAVPIQGSDLVEARATVIARAPIDKARATIRLFEDYPQYMPEYSDAKRLGKLPSGNEKVYMEITTLGGVAKMFANVEVLPARKEGEAEIHEARFIDGNVRQFKAIWTLTPTTDGNTELTLQVFLHPSLPLPDFLVNKANLDGAKKGALAMKRRIEGAR